MGPDWIQIGTEGGFLPEPVVIPPQPINWNMNATAFNVGNVTDHSLLLGCAERADVLVDFSNFAGQHPHPLQRCPDRLPGARPALRLLHRHPGPDRRAAARPPPSPATAPTRAPSCRSGSEGPVGGSPLAGITVLTGGADYLSSPEVDINNGGGSGATATALCSIDHVTVLSGGSGYASAPSVNFSRRRRQRRGGSSDRLTRAGDQNHGHQLRLGLYLRPHHHPDRRRPHRRGDGNSALYVSAITLDTPGSGYTSLPEVTLVGGGGYGATAVAFFPSGTPYDLAQLQAVWRRDGAKTGVFEVYQDPIIMPQAAYNCAYGANYPADNSVFVQLHDFSKTFFGGRFRPIMSSSA